MKEDQEKITVVQKVTIEIINWAQFNDVCINQDGNTIYVDQDNLPQLIEALQKFVK